jgi:hypothetical protein
MSLTKLVLVNSRHRFTIHVRFNVLRRSYFFVLQTLENSQCLENYVFLLHQFGLCIYIYILNPKTLSSTIAAGRSSYCLLSHIIITQFEPWLLTLVNGLCGADSPIAHLCKAYPGWFTWWNLPLSAPRLYIP